MNPYDSNDPTRAYSSTYSTGSDPALRRDYEERPDPRQDPQWGAPPKPQPMNLSRFGVSAAFVAVAAGAIAWALVTVTNNLPATAAGAVLHRDPESAAIGTGLLTLVAAAVLVGLVYSAARPGLVFGCLAGGAVIVLLVWAWVSGALGTWQAWISTGLLNSLLVVAIAGVLYALGRATVNTNVVQDY